MDRIALIDKPLQLIADLSNTVVFNPGTHKVDKVASDDYKTAYRAAKDGDGITVKQIARRLLRQSRGHK